MFRVALEMIRFEEAVNAGRSFLMTNSNIRGSVT
jgi:hypothetical protein